MTSAAVELDGDVVTVTHLERVRRYRLHEQRQWPGHPWPRATLVHLELLSAEEFRR